jgi:LysM repeat protein
MPSHRLLPLLVVPALVAAADNPKSLLDVRGGPALVDVAVPHYGSPSKPYRQDSRVEGLANRATATAAAVETGFSAGKGIDSALRAQVGTLAKELEALQAAVQFPTALEQRQLDLAGAALATAAELVDRSTPLSVIQHTVKSGDTIDSLAATYHVKPVIIAEANQLKPGRRLETGAVLTIPGGRLDEPAKAAPAGAAAPAEPASTPVEPAATPAPAEPAATPAPAEPKASPVDPAPTPAEPTPTAPAEPAAPMEPTPTAPAEPAAPMEPVPTDAPAETPAAPAPAEPAAAPAETPAATPAETPAAPAEPAPAAPSEPAPSEPAPAPAAPAEPTPAAPSEPAPAETPAAPAPTEPAPAAPSEPAPAEMPAAPAEPAPAAPSEPAPAAPSGELPP